MCLVLLFVTLKNDLTNLLPIVKKVINLAISPNGAHTADTNDAAVTVPLVIERNSKLKYVNLVIKFGNKNKWYKIK